MFSFCFNTFSILNYFWFFFLKAFSWNFLTISWPLSSSITLMLKLQYFAIFSNLGSLLLLVSSNSKSPLESILRGFFFVVLWNVLLYLSVLSIYIHFLKLKSYISSFYFFQIFNIFSAIANVSSLCIECDSISLPCNHSFMTWWHSFMITTVSWLSTACFCLIFN